MDEQNPITPAAPEAAPTPVEPAPVASAEPAPVEPAPAAPVAEPVAQPVAPVPAEPVPVAQPAAAPVASAPKKSKTGLIVVIVILLLVAIAGGIAAVFLIPALSKVDYTSAYRKAKDVKTLVAEISEKTNCEKVVKYAESYSNVTSAEYAKYVKECKAEVEDTIGSSITALGETDGVAKDSEIKEKFDAFKKAYDELVAFGDGLDEKLAVYEEMQAFLYNAKGGTRGVHYSCGCLGCDTPISTDDQIEAIVASLVESDDERLAEFGETWATMAKATRDKGEAYYNASKSRCGFNENAEQKQLYQEYMDNKEALEKYVKENLPSAKVLYPIEVPTGDAVTSAFSKLYDAIKNANEKNYNSESHDCVEFLDIVTCE